MQKYINSCYDTSKPPTIKSRAPSSNTKPADGRQRGRINMLSKGSGPLPQTTPNHQIPTPTIYTGDAQTLLKMNRWVKRDIESYICELTEPSVKDGHELIKPTGRSFVYLLKLEEDEKVDISEETRGNIDAWIAMDNDEEPPEVVQESTIETSKASLAPEVADGHISNKDDSDIEETPASLPIHDASSLKALAGGVLDQHNNPNESANISRTSTARPIIVISPPNFSSPPLDAAPTQPGAPQSAIPRARLRHSSPISLAALIADANAADFPLPDNSPDSDSDSDSECTPPAKSKIPCPCYESTFPSHVPCTTHSQRKYWRLRKAVTKVLRGRWEGKWEEGRKLRGQGAPWDGRKSGLGFELEILEEEEEEEEKEKKGDREEKEKGEEVIKEVGSEMSMGQLEVIVEEDEDDGADVEISIDRDWGLRDSICWLRVRDTRDEIPAPDVISAEQEILAAMEATDDENHDAVDGATVTEDSPQHKASDAIEVIDTDTSNEATFENDARPSLPHPDSSDPNTNEDKADLESTSAEFSQDISYLRPGDIRVLLDVQCPAPRMIHIRNASMNDVLSDVSSTRTTIFSKQASISTKSSQSSLSVKSSKYSQLIDALDLSTGRSNRQDSGSLQTPTMRTLSLSNTRIASNGISKVEKNMNIAPSAAVLRDDALLEFGTARVLGTTIAHRQLLHATKPANARPHHIDTLYPSENVRGNTEFVAAPSLSDSGNTLADDYPYEDNKKPHHYRKWYTKLSRTMGEVSGKAQELAKAAKKFGLTLRVFVR